MWHLIWAIHELSVCESVRILHAVMRIPAQTIHTWANISVTVLDVIFCDCRWQNERFIIGIMNIYSALYPTMSITFYLSCFLLCIKLSSTGTSKIYFNLFINILLLTDGGKCHVQRRSRLPKINSRLLRGQLPYTWCNFYFQDNSWPYLQCIEAVYGDEPEVIWWMYSTV